MNCVPLLVRSFFLCAWSKERKSNVKKAISLILAMVLVFSLTIGASAKRGNSNGNSNHENSNEEKVNNGITQTQKEFKAELNDEKKAAIDEKASLTKEIRQLESQYEELLAAGDSEGAEVLLAEIDELNAQLEECEATIKEANNERFMIVKTMYTEEELATFENAGAAIDAMYADAAIHVLEAGCVMVNGSVVKFDTPAYIKGGVALVPLRAIVDELGAEVSWDEETQSVTIIKDGVSVTMTIGSTTVSVGNASDESDENSNTEDDTTDTTGDTDTGTAEATTDDTTAVTVTDTEGSTVTGTTDVADDDITEETQTEVDTAPEITNNRAYVPIRFLAEALNLAVSWDTDNQTIDIDEPTETAADTDQTTGNSEPEETNDTSGSDESTNTSTEL
jgi:hypothetical protein